MRISDWSSDVCSSDLLPLRKPDVVDVGESDAHRLADGDTFGVGAHDLGGDANDGSTVDVDHGQGEWNGHVGRPGLVVDGVAVDCPCSRNWFEFNSFVPAFGAAALRRVDRMAAGDAKGDTPPDMGAAGPEGGGFGREFGKRAHGVFGWRVGGRGK